MKTNRKIFIGLLLITFGLGNVLLVGLTRDKVVWEHRGQILDYGGDIMQKLPPNPVLGDAYVMRVSADFYNLYYMHYSNTGTINFTSQDSGRTYEFEYYLSKAEGDFDSKEKRWSLHPGQYNVTWTNDNCAYMYKLIKVGIGYPYNNLVFIISITISLVFSISGIGLIYSEIRLIREVRKVKDSLSK
ncbi:MAG: hypothetical protein ACFFA3_08285 [Promethearchaeota archaeon]